MKKFSLVTAILILLVSLGCGTSVAFAAAVYSDVLADLSKDAAFTLEDYPTSDKTSLEVIQIAESAERELFLYVYTPSGLAATSANISISEELNYVNYPLVLLSQSAALHKYKVQGIYVGADETRKYNISAIYRKWIEGDAEPPKDEKVSEVSYAVGQEWTVTADSGKVTYARQDVETIKVTNKHVGFVRYKDGYKFWQAAYTDSHYVAFDTDKYIEKLREAEVYYVSQYVTSASFPLGGGQTDYDDPVEHYVKFDDQATGETAGDGWFGTKYVYDRIEKTSDFVADKNNGLDSTAKEELADTRWILRFSETPYGDTYFPNGSSTGFRTKISDVSILRLKFETAGKVYNLGVVDNKQTGSGVPDNNTGLPIWIIAAIAVAILLIFALIFKPVATVVVWICKLLWYIISAPVRLVIWIVNKAKEKKQ
ncbi:MAG: hypothetical protein NC350_05055 [Corallococcus sp.]|nr:hypothetical protein [Corallococcus sp.]